MLEIYIEALLVNEELADQVWEAWDKGKIDDQVAWWLIAFVRFTPKPDVKLELLKSSANDLCGRCPRTE